MSWCFAKVNKRLAEIFFDETKKGLKISGHCYVKKEEYKTQKEQKWIKEDTARLQFRYKNKRYKRIVKPSKKRLNG